MHHTHTHILNTKLCSEARALLCLLAVVSMTRKTFFWDKNKYLGWCYLMLAVPYFNCSSPFSCVFWLLLVCSLFLLKTVYSLVSRANSLSQAQLSKLISVALTGQLCKPRVDCSENISNSPTVCQACPGHWRVLERHLHFCRTYILLGFHLAAAFRGWVALG